MIQQFAKYIDVSKPASNGMNLLGLIIKKKWLNTLNEVLKYNPQILNQCGSNNVYPVEYLINHNWYDSIQKYAQYIDFTLPATNKKSLFGLLIKNDWPTTIKKVLATHPSLIDSKVPIVPISSSLKIQKVVEEEVHLKPMSKYRKLI